MIPISNTHQLNLLNTNVQCMNSINKIIMYSLNLLLMNGCELEPKMPLYIFQTEKYGDENKQIRKVQIQYVWGSLPDNTLCYTTINDLAHEVGVQTQCSLFNDLYQQNNVNC